MRREDYDEAGWGRVLQDRWDRLQSLVDDGTLERHPGIESWNEHSKLLRDAKRAKDAAGSGLGARELEENDQPRPQTGQDDSNPQGPNPPRAPERNGASLQQGMDSIIHLNRLIPGYGRIRSPYSPNERPPVDDDGIVQPRSRGR